MFEKALIQVVDVKKRYPLISSFVDRFFGSMKEVKAVNGVSLYIQKRETPV